MQSLKAPLPCPFCGNNPHVDKTSGDERDGYTDTVKISCPCGCVMTTKGIHGKGPYADNTDVHERAVKKWNTRVVK